MKLSRLIENLEVTECTAGPELEIKNLVSDSRRVTPGDAFIAVRGFEQDGHRFIPAALTAGAAVIIAEEPVEGAPYVRVTNSRHAMAVAAGNFYGNPARSLHMIGVTGTNGKTTTTNLIKEILERAAGAKVGLIGTNRNMIGQDEYPTERTTPDCLELQALLRRMVDEGCTHAVMEVSSHALCLERVAGIRFAEAVFTNLTEDHLDFHKTMEAYAQAKAKLFTMCDTAILNIDDPWCETMRKSCTGRVFTYSARSDEADLTARTVRLYPDRVEFCALMTGKLERLKLGIPGMFSVYNALAAVSAAFAAGVRMEAIRDALAQCKPVTGRAEVVPTGRPYTVLIDYAHTPDALENILDTVREFTRGRVIAVFGCGGDRDPMKRPIMGAIAVDKADYVIVTSDNPRTERPEAIIRAIVRGIEEADADTPFEVIADRRAAIARALKIAGPGDTVVLAGKGHETYQEIDHVKRHFDEREVVAELLSETQE